MNMLGAKLAPVLEPVGAQFRDWIANNREWIATQITEKVGEFVTWLQQLDWQSIGEQMRSFVRSAGDLIDKLGGAKGAMIAIGLITFSPVIAGLLEIGAAVARLALAFSTTLVAAIRIAGEAMLAFNRSTMALPVFRILALTLGAYDKTMQGTPVTPQNTPPGSRDFHALTPEQQEESRKLHPPGSEGSGSWLRDQLGDVWRNMLTPPAGTPPPSAGGGGGIPFGPQLVPLPSQRPAGAIPTLKILPDLSGWPAALPDARPSGVMPQADRGPALPNLYAQTGAPGLPGQQGAVDVNVRFADAPPGIEVDTQSTGSVRVPRPEVGYAFGFERLGFA